MFQILEEDVFGIGKNQIIINNNAIKAVIVPEVGGRIAQIQNGETQFLYRTYPQGVDFGPYTEYGGIEECIGGAPGTLWNVAWKCDKKDNGVLLQTTSKSVLVRKFITIDENEPIIKIKYDLINLGNTFSRFTFGIHPEISVGSSFRDNKYHISSKQEAINGGYEGAGVKKSIATPDGWCAVTNNGKAFGQMFPMDTIDSIEVYYPKVNTHLVIQPMILGVGVAPDMCASFMYMIYAGNGDANIVKETREWLDKEFTVGYKPFDKTDVPKDVLVAPTPVQHDIFVDINPVTHIEPELMKLKEELEKVAKIKIPKIDIPKIPQIPNINFMAEKHQKRVEEEMERVNRRIERDVEREMERVNREMERVNREIERANREQERAIRMAEKENRHRERIHVEDTFDSEAKPLGENADKLMVRHTNGKISISVWDEPYIYYKINGNCKIIADDEQIGKEAIAFEMNGDLSLNIPQRISEIELSFINGTVNINDYSSRLHISGVNGVINVSMGNLPDDGSISMSLVSGEIKLAISENSSCRIQATCTIGNINCDLPIQEEIRTQRELKGTLNDGTANILLSIVRGDISIEKI